MVLKIRGKSCIEAKKSPKHFWRNVVRGNKVFLSKKSLKRTEVVTRVLEEIRSEHLRIYIAKGRGIKPKHITL